MSCTHGILKREELIYTENVEASTATGSTGPDYSDGNHQPVNLINLNRNIFLNLTPYTRKFLADNKPGPAVPSYCNHIDNPLVNIIECDYYWGSKF